LEEDSVLWSSFQKISGRRQCTVVQFPENFWKILFTYVERKLEIVKVIKHQLGKGETYEPDKMLFIISII